MNNAAVNTTKTMLTVRLHAVECMQESCTQEQSALLVAAISPENFQPLHEFLQFHGDTLMGNIENSMGNLQDIFVTALHKQMLTYDIAADVRFVLYLSEQGQLLVEGSGVLCDAVQKALDAKPVLSAVFTQIRARAVILQSLEKIQSGLNICHNSNSYDAQNLFAAYKICIKGHLSHFYLQ